MARLVVLVRHAKAEERAGSSDDLSRRLTEAGLRSCRAAMARMATLLTPDAKGAEVCVWTSGAARARQTAQVAAEALGVGRDGIRIVDALTRGDVDALLAELSATDDVVVAVGHNPSLESLVKRACGQRAHLGKASAVCLVPVERDPGSGALDPRATDEDTPPTAPTSPAVANEGAEGGADATDAALDFADVVQSDERAIAAGAPLGPARPEGAEGSVHPADAAETGAASADGGLPEPSQPRKEGAKEEPAYELAWFLQGPHASRWETLVALEGALARASEKVSSNAWKLLDCPDDPEALHQYRISLRVARSLLAFVRPDMRRGQWRRTAELLRRLQGPTSQLRELDVMYEQLNDDDARLAYADADELLDACARRRDAVRRDFVDGLSDPRTQRDLHRVVQLLRAPAWRDQVERRGISRLELRGRYLDLTRAYLADLAACDFGDAEATHSIRKRSKQQRYVARELADVLGQDCGRLGAQAKATQELLGELCDARVNLALAARLRQEGLPGQADAQTASPEGVEAPSPAAVTVAPECSGAHAGDALAADGGASPADVDAAATREPRQGADAEPPTYAQVQRRRIRELLDTLAGKGGSEPGSRC
ncbi:MAG: CHAD domain-containing protein [Coriobacteriales bacterium]|jgi:phosphohistidine phosphatase SixA/CHAD domain-containing protein